MVRDRLGSEEHRSPFDDVLYQYLRKWGLEICQTKQVIAQGHMVK